MIRGAVIRGVIGLLVVFAFFSAVSPVVGGLNELYLRSIGSCNFGDEENPKRALVFGTDSDFVTTGDINANMVDWNTATNVVKLAEGTNGVCVGGGNFTANAYYVSTNGDIEFQYGGTAGTALEVSAMPYKNFAKDPSWAEPAGLFDEPLRLLKLLGFIAVLSPVPNHWL